MRKLSVTKTLLILANCLVLASFICPKVLAQRDVKKKEQEKTEKTTTETQAETQTTTQKETASINSKSSNDRKKIIVVLNFDSKSPQCKDEIYGQNVATRLSTEFSSRGEYTVIEKQRIEDVFKEINISQDERYSTETAAKVGKVLSANTVVLGTITQCSTDVKKINFRLAKYIERKVRVTLAIRLVNINTGEVQDAISITESGSDKGGAITGIGSIDSEISPDLQIKLFNEAVEKTVKKAVKDLGLIIYGKTKGTNVTKIETIVAQQNQTIQNTSSNSQISNQTTNTNPTPTQENSIFPQVTKVSGKIVYLIDLKNVKVGDTLTLMRGEEITNTRTGKIMFDGKDIAKVRVIEITEDFVKAEIVSGTPQVNDRVKIGK